MSTGAAQFTADEVGLQCTWAWDLSPLSAKCLPSSPEVVRNLFPYGKGLIIILLHDLETFIFVPFVDDRPLSARLYEVLETQQPHRCPCIAPSAIQRYSLQMKILRSEVLIPYA